MDAGISIDREDQKFGFSISYIDLGLYTERTSGFGLNLGYALDLKNGINIGLAVQNIGRMKTLSSKAPSLPMRLSTGASKLIRSDRFVNNIFGSVEWNSVVAASKIYLGNRLSWKRLDILDGYFTFIKITQMLNETQKYNIIKLICKYISLFHTLHEHDIELAFFTNELNKTIK